MIEKRYKYGYDKRPVNIPEKFAAGDTYAAACIARNFATGDADFVSKVARGYGKKWLDAQKYRLGKE